MINAERLICIICRGIYVGFSLFLLATIVAIEGVLNGYRVLLAHDSCCLCLHKSTFSKTFEKSSLGG